MPFPTPGDLPDPGMEPWSPASPALAGGFFTTEPPGKYGLIQWYNNHKVSRDIEETIFLNSIPGFVDSIEEARKEDKTNCSVYQKGEEW